MLDKIAKVLYFIFIIITTYIVVTVAEVTKIESFIEDQLGIIKESSYSDFDLIQTVALTYSNKKNEAYVYKESLFKENYEYLGDNGAVVYKFELVFYKYVESLKKSHSNSLAIIINELEINDSSLFLTDREQPVIDLDIEYDKPFYFQNNKFTSSIERFQSYEGLNSYILLINYDFLKTDLGYVNFKTMNFKYRIIGDETSYKPLLTIYNEDLYSIDEDIVVNDKIKEDINRSLIPLHSDQIVFKNLNIDDIKISDEFYNDKNIKKSLSKKNYYYYKYLGIELLIVLVVTYALFLHKDVMILVNKRKAEKQRQFEEIKKELHKEEENK